DVPGQKFFYSERAAQVLGLPHQREYLDLASMVRDATTEETWSGLAAELLGYLGESSSVTLDIDFPLKGDAAAPGWARLKGQVLLGPRGNVIRVSGSVADTTDMHRHAEEIRLRSITDELTNLPNRSALMAHIESALRGASHDGTQVALFVLDIDGFKRVNDTLGHHVGDELIKETARRLRAVMRETDFVARLGGDEFAVLMKLNTEVQARHAGRKIHVALQRPVALGEHVLNIDASIGAAFYPDHGDNAAAMLRHADVAMYQSKRLREPFSIYVAEADPNSLRSLRIENDLRTAITDGSLQLYYQPKIHLPSRTLSGVEALLRWIHPELGPIAPMELIPLAERTGLIRPLTRWIVDAALTQQAEWESSGLRISVAINLSIWDLEDPGLVRYIEQRIREHGATPDRIEFEITESMMMTDPEGTLGTLSRLRQLGVRLSIDDFGTGFSSLAYLKRFPVTGLKIDKSFVQKIPDSEKDQAIVRSIVSLAHSLGLEVIGEGVEDTACMTLLAEIGCDIAQGYHITRAVPASEFAQWLAKSGFGYARKPQATSFRSINQ
ncbi:MAG: EAL domain-containing protein, partial [Gammaproteobacteria bacterium]|nr:EAL domain-containing protein [Gammaproteobacteria bacterium]